MCCVCVCVSRLPIPGADSHSSIENHCLTTLQATCPPYCPFEVQPAEVVISTGILDRTSWRGLVPLHDIRESRNNLSACSFTNPSPSGLIRYAWYTKVRVVYRIESGKAQVIIGG